MAAEHSLWVFTTYCLKLLPIVGIGFAIRFGLSKSMTGNYALDVARFRLSFREKRPDMAKKVWRSMYSIAISYIAYLKVGAR